ncbi:MAG: AMP-binding protein [Hyphomicrobiaceae bacterium]
MANASLYARIETALRDRPDAVALRATSGETQTNRLLLEAIDRMAAALLSLGVGPGDRVTVQVEKSLANVALYLATLKIGAIYNPLNSAYTAAELDYFLGDAEPRVLVADPERAAVLAPIAAARGVAQVVTLDAAGHGTLATLAAAQSGPVATAECAPTDLAALLYTSGTTGRSKGAMITHENLLSNAETLVSYWGFEGGDVLLHALPIFHVHGLFVALNTAFLSGAEIIWLPKFDVASMLALMPEATVVMGVPTFYTRLLAEPSFGRSHTGKLRIVVSGSAPLLAETHVAFEERTGLQIVERYGMTEAGMITSNPYRVGARIAGTVGYALPGISVRLTGEGGSVVGPGEVGVLEVKGPNVFSGYWRMPDKTAEEFRSDGYFVSGDLATMAGDGRVTIVGRAKDLIISGGYNIYPKEIENEINDIAGVGESAVIGVPHADFGECVIAVITAAASGAVPTPDEVMARLAGRLAKFKLPKAVILVDELPRNAMGKVQKAELRERYRSILG